MNCMERPKQRKTETRFVIRNVRSLYRSRALNKADRKQNGYKAENWILLVQKREHGRAHVKALKREVY
jgi:hypothetical protein